MEKKIKFIILALLVILAAAFLVNLQTYASKKAVERERNDLKRENETLARKIDETVKEKKQLEERIVLLTGDLDKLSQEKESLERIKEGLQRRYELVVREKGEFTEKINSAKGENETLKQQIKSLSEGKEDLENKLAQLQKEKSSLQQKISQLDKSKESIELSPIVVRSQPQDNSPQEKEAAAGQAGKILAVNKDNNFVIIDLGEESGVETGKALKVYRQEEPVGAIEVIEVRKNISACDIKNESAPIEVGDTVR